ncbi:LCP family protein [Streptosporangium saharense]|uniref:LCP family protein required for cell wall assembly n=1 Tax=Streptosporangium saharense TaxID=1706840 RepID=A0A7W7VLJ7_9ACTN|nr:LCP family protein [Streptosporangium saharense]MBB4914250.1 LCP family protein required for cell wall assembly [Streptosporangium saharense]
MSDHRHVAVSDHTTEPALPGRRASRRAGRNGVAPEEISPLYQETPRKGGGGRSKGGGKTGKLGIGSWISIALTGVMVVGTLTGYKFYRDIEGNISREDVEDKLGANRPPETGALNVLVVGSDSRDGAGNKKYGQHLQGTGERTDTIILLHISPNRDKATLISFPRDSMVQAPDCQNPKTKALIPAGLRQINATFNDGGIACTWKTIETLTQIHINHFVKVDFSGFKGIIDALGGIEICLPKDVMDKKAKLDLKKGKHIVKGETALAYVRARYTLGDGSDISRIKRQQVFLTQVMKKATSSDLLTSLPKLTAFLEAATSSVTMDRNLTTGRLLEIAQSAASLNAKGLKSVTVPWKPYAPDPGRVEWAQPKADQLFAAIRSDIEVQPTATPKPSASPGQTTAPAKPAIKPAQVRVQVLNGTNTSGRAQEVADALAAQGFTVVEVGDARLPSGADQPRTRVLYAKNAQEGADYATPVTAKLLNKTKVKPEGGKIRPGSSKPYVPTAATTAPTATPTASAPTAPVDGQGPVIQLVIGADWEGVAAPIKIPDSIKDDVVDANTNPCL